MIFLLPFAAAKAAAATITLGEMIAITATTVGIGAGIKGAIDYNKAKKLKEEAAAEYVQMTKKIRRRSAKLKKSSMRLAA
jgi:hypothetical protein